MRITVQHKIPTLVVLASTFPRWPNDTVPPFVWNYVQGIARYASKVVVVAPHFPGAKRHEQLTNTIGVQRFRYAPDRHENLAYGQFVKSKFYLLKTVCYVVAESWTTLRVCLSNRPAVINAHWLVPQGFVGVVVGRLLRAKVIVTVHGSDVFMFNGALFRYVKRFTLRHADRVIVNSSVTQAACRELWPHKDYSIIPMGIDVSTFALEKREPVNKKPFELLFVGRLAPIKGVEYACQAVAQLIQQGLDVHLTIIGDGPEHDAVATFIKEHKLSAAITLAGWVQPQALPERYARSDVFVGPSIEDPHGRREALGLVFAEAAAAGLPVITTNTGGMTDIVQDQKTGFIVPQKDASAIAEAIRYLYEHPQQARAMGNLGRAHVSDRMSWDRVVANYRRALGL